MIIAATGHRPKKLAPREIAYSKHVRERLTHLATAYLKREKPSEVISGMAPGWDTAVAIASLDLKIPLIVAVPFKGQESRWSEYDKGMYDLILRLAANVFIVSPGGYEPQKMQLRNIWMTDRCHKLVALWDGSNGGTRNCIAYAEEKGVPFDNLWSSWVKHRGF